MPTHLAAAGLLLWLASPGTAAADSWLRFSRPLYAASDCVQLTLPEHEATVHVAVARRGARVGAFDVVLQAATSQRPVSDCLALPPGAALEAGDVLGAAWGPTMQRPTAVALAMIGGRAERGEVQIAVDEQMQTSKQTGALESDGHVMRFRPGRVVLHLGDAARAASFLDRHHGQIISRHAGGRGGYALVSVDASGMDTDSLPAILERWTGARGTLRVSSSAALRTLALVITEGVAGTAVELDVVADGTHAPVSRDATDLFDGASNPLFDPRLAGGLSQMHFGEGLALAQIVLKPGSMTPTPLAIIDGGFAAPSDFSPPFPNPDYGRPFASIPQCAIDADGNVSCGPNTAGGANPGQCGSSACTWHGTWVLSAAMAELHNASGAAGAGSHAVEVALYRTDGTFLSLATALHQAVNPASGPPAKIINMSLGVACRHLGINLCDPTTTALLSGAACGVIALLFPVLSALTCAEIAALVAIVGPNDSMFEQAVLEATQKDAIVVVGASNDDEDQADVLTRPCTFGAALCVSSVATGAGSGAPVVRASGRGFGAAVRVFAPDAAWVTPDPDTGGAISQKAGTSIATGWVSGMLAVARAIAPALPRDQILDLLAKSTCSSAHPGRRWGSACWSSPDASVDASGYVDYLELVRRAREAAGRHELLPCSGGWDAAEVNGRTDSAQTALELPALRWDQLQREVELEGDRDRSIHGFGPVVDDEDWYHLEFTPRTQPGPTGPVAQGVLVVVSVRVQDKALGRLSVSIYREPIASPVQVPAQSAQHDSSTGVATYQAVLRTDRNYFIKVSTSAIDSRESQSNCYETVSAKVLEKFPLPEQ